MRILRLELSDVRQFHQQRFEFGPGFNLLVGENGAGKSTVLRSLLSALGNAENFKLADRLAPSSGGNSSQHSKPILNVTIKLLRA